MERSWLQRIETMDWSTYLPNPRCSTGMEVATILFPTASFTVTQAKRWAKRHGHRYGEVDTTANYHRLRQLEPDAIEAGTFRTIDFGDSGIKAVVGCPKRRSNPTITRAQLSSAKRKIRRWMQAQFGRPIARVTNDEALAAIQMAANARPGDLKAKLLAEDLSSPPDAIDLKGIR